jgi:hypothetical protein
MVFPGGEEDMFEGISGMQLAQTTFFPVSDPGITSQIGTRRKMQQLQRIYLIEV